MASLKTRLRGFLHEVGWYESPKAPGSGGYDRYSDLSAAARFERPKIVGIEFHEDITFPNRSFPTVSPSKEGTKGQR